MKLSSIDLITENSSGSKRVFLTITIEGKDYEHFVDCPLDMKETPQEYINKNLEKIAGDITKEESFTLDEGEFKKDYKHPPKIKKMKEIESARNVEEKVDLIIEMLKNI